MLASLGELSVARPSPTRRTVRGSRGANMRIPSAHRRQVVSRPHYFALLVSLETSSFGLWISRPVSLGSVPTPVRLARSLRPLRSSVSLLSLQEEPRDSTRGAWRFLRSGGDERPRERAALLVLYSPEDSELKWGTGEEMNGRERGPSNSSEA